ncbi:Uncharacterized MFS-type transporter ytbD [Vibrio nigripulchritudo SO65]|uniref:MFS transporter n=1 Tax=Vibrio nigripulchritudo TaxID=28173 RepID=UPI0003B1AF12|nr:MFS transporter [Vibrio nigripulchritudo]CCN38001.1 Uncharacterized MFS-type transporter ytbD [Vibrio nigripulchritudo AM115]CCN39016.1 Uncharacterized MFS-type transporter ytbD [Vibrio nigripulchritudo FTn2]CCN64003.1 Uncharacterized MFS-type transporter ytbD [Vibrio nigripulchritudo POn4]CCN76483.1 Uncharacterized MFS-type transporter ytbD [Vibrio nigripulchritudo SO65]
MPVALFALTICAFAIGTTEFVIVGLIPTIAEQLDVSIPSAGLLVSIYAFGVAIGAPILTALTNNLSRKTLLLSLMILFTIGNLAAWQSPSYSLLIFARLLTGLAHGVFFSIGSTIATGLVSKDKAASAIAIMFGGLTVALVTGVPLGTYIGQEFGWRTTFLAVASLGAIAILAISFLIPRTIKNPPPSRISEQFNVITHPKLLLVYLTTALGYGGVFAAFTYLAPIMSDITGFEKETITWILLVYGISVAVGNIGGGKLADRIGPIPALKLIFLAMIAILVILQFAMYDQVSAFLIILVMGAFAFGNVPGLQVYVVQQAEKYVPNAVDTASGLNIAAFNVGIALGSIVGGLAVEHLGLEHTPWISACIVGVALVLTFGLGILDDRKQAPVKVR